MSEWKTYRPSNGTEGDRFQEIVCRGCKEDLKAHDCDIINRSFWHDLEDDKYPEELQIRWTGNPSRPYEIRCTARREEEIVDLRTKVAELEATIETIEHEVAIVYCELTSGKISKPNTVAQHVIDEANAEYDRLNNLSAMRGYDALNEKLAELESRVEETEQKNHEMLVQYNAINTAWLERGDRIAELEAAWDSMRECILYGGIPEFDCDRVNAVLSVIDDYDPRPISDTDNTDESKRGEVDRALAEVCREIDEILGEKRGEVGG